MRKYTSLLYTEYPVASGNYDPTVRSTVDMIILHSTAGTYESAVAYFNNPKAGTSAHYIISNNGEIAAMLEEYFVGYHAGSYAVNQKSVAIEHEGYTGLVRTEAEYQMSIKLVADICKFYNIPCDRTHILAHREVVATACPTDLDVDRIVRDANKLLNGTPVPPPQPTLPPELAHYVLNWKDIAIAKGLDVNTPMFSDYRNIDKIIAKKVDDATSSLQKDNAALNIEIEDLTAKLSVSDVAYKSLFSLSETYKTDMGTKLAECESKRLQCESIQPIIKTTYISTPKVYKTKVAKALQKLADQLG